MKRLLAVAVLAVAFAGCSTKSEAPAETVVEPVDVPDIDTSPVGDEDEYIHDARDFGGPGLDSIDDQLLIETGDAVCFALDAGVTPAEVVQTGLDSGLPEQALTAVIAASIVNLCPQHDGAFG